MAINTISLRPSVEEDLEYFFQFQLDKEANYLAAFTQQDPTDKAAYIEKYSLLYEDPSTHNKTILVDNEIAGSIARFIMFGENDVSYWIGKQYWGKGVATIALQQFLEIEKTRPLHGRVAFDNYGSQKVLEKCGFVKTGSDKGFANARGKEIEEFIYKLD